MANPIEEFRNVINDIYHVFLDSRIGFMKLREEFESSQQGTLEWFKGDYPELGNMEYLDSLLHTYGSGDPNDPASYAVNESTQGEYKQRNAEGGANPIFMGNMCLVAIYQYWEDVYRKEIAAFLGQEKEDLKMPIMGDLRLLRRSIIHHHGVALPDIQKCEVLKWFKPEEMIVLDYPKMEFIVFSLRNALDALH